MRDYVDQYPDYFARLNASVGHRTARVRIVRVKPRLDTPLKKREWLFYTDRSDRRYFYHLHNASIPADITTGGWGKVRDGQD